MTRPRRSLAGQPLLAIPLAVVILLLMGAALPPVTDKDRSAPHGALPMDEQIRRLEALQGEIDPAAAPPGVDPYMWEKIVPENNPQTAERIALGKKLYFDTRLSSDGTVACATCHDVSRGFTDNRPLSEGVGGQLGRRNAPTTANALLMETQFLDGRTPSLEEQSKLPIINPVEMAHDSPAAAMAAIEDDPEYRRMFQAAYGSKPNYEDLARAIGAFERTLVFMDTPFDRFLAGDTGAISAQAKQGWELFNGKARCMSCHQLNASNPIGTDYRFHNIGVAAHAQNFEQLAVKALQALEGDEGLKAVDRLALETDLSELGRFLVTKDIGDIGSFKTSQLRNVALTSPYMHDGSMRTLWDVMDHYNKGGEANPYLDGGIEPLALTDDEINAVVAFLFTLTDSRFAEQNRSELERQIKLAAERRPFRDEALANREVLPFEERATGGRLGTGVRDESGEEGK